MNEVYKNNPGISQSRLKLIERKPLEYLNFTYNDETRNKGMNRGKFVDEILLTHDIEASIEQFFNENIVLNQVPTDTVTTILKSYYNAIKYGSIEDSGDSLFKVAREHEYGAANWKIDTVISKLTENGGKEYLQALEDEKNIVSREEKDTILEIVRYFQNNKFFNELISDCIIHPVETIKYNSFILKRELDLLHVDTNSVFDLKIINQPLTSFFWSYFIGYRYDIQSAFYSNTGDELRTFSFIVYSTVDKCHAVFSVSKELLQSILGNNKHYYNLDSVGDTSKRLSTVDGLLHRVDMHQTMDKWELPYEYYMNEYSILEITTWM